MFKKKRNKQKKEKKKKKDNEDKDLKLTERIAQSIFKTINPLNDFNDTEYMTDLYPPRGYNPETADKKTIKEVKKKIRSAKLEYIVSHGKPIIRGIFVGLTFGLIAYGFNQDLDIQDTMTTAAKYTTAVDFVQYTVRGAINYLKAKKKR